MERTSCFFNNIFGNGNKWGGCSNCLEDNDEWKVYSNSSRQHKELGNSHNRAIYELCRENPTLRYGSNISDSALSSMIETKLKQMGYSDVGISSLEWGNIIILIRNLKNALNTSSDLNNVFIAGISSSPTLDYQFLDEYLDSVLLLEDREEMITFTEKYIQNRLFTRGEKRVVKGNGFDCIVQYKPLGSYLINISFEKKAV